MIQERSGLDEEVGAAPGGPGLMDNVVEVPEPTLAVVVLVAMVILYEFACLPNGRNASSPPCMSWISCRLHEGCQGQCLCLFMKQVSFLSRVDNKQFLEPQIMQGHVH